MEEIFYGLTDFCVLSRMCRPDWPAWAAMGAWAAAVATFLAVVLPFYSARAKDRVRSQLALTDFANELSGLSAEMSVIEGLVEKANDVSSEMFAAMLRLNASFPVLEPTPRDEEIIVAIRMLKGRLEGWNGAITAAGAVPRPNMDLSRNASMKAMIASQFAKVRDDIERIREAIRRAYPGMR